MKKTTTIFLLSIWAFLFASIGTQVNGQISISAHNTSINTNFNGWNGTMPNGFARSANNNYMGTAPSTTGGVYAIPNMGFGYQPSSNQSATTTSVTGAYVNNTGGTITELKITYDAFKIVNREFRNPCWTVNVSSGVFGTNLNWCSNQADATKTFTSVVSIPSGATFTITLNSDRGTGSSSSPLIGFNNIKVESIQAACVTPDAPISEPQFFCSTATVNDLFADGENIKWYASQDATIALTTDTALQTGTYYVTQTVNNCESDKAPVEISVQPAPEAPVAEAQSFCGTATVADLIAEGINLNWYDSANSTTPLTTTTQLQNGTYYVTQTVNNCPSSKTQVEITINEIPAAPVAEAQSFCGTATVADLIPASAEGTPPLVEGFEADIPGSISGSAQFDLGMWATQNIGTNNEPGNSISGYAARFNFFPTMISPEIDNIVSISFYGKATADKTLSISKIVNGNESHLQTVTLQPGEMQLFTVNVNELSENVKIKFVGQDTLPTGYVDNVTFYQPNSVDANISWFASETSTDILSNETPLETGTYYVSQILNGCESARTAVEITVNEIPTAPTADAQSFCGTATVADLVAEGTNLAWFETIDSTEELTPETELTSGSYFVAQSANDCTSERTAVEISVNEIPNAPTAEAQSFCGEAAVADLVAEGTNLTWFDSIDSTEELTPETELTSGTYYVAQSANDCTSERIAVEISVNEIPNAPTAEAQSFCGEATVADLVAEGTNLAWYATENSIEELTAETELTSGTYFVAQSANDCTSERTAVEITVNEIPAAPEAQDQSFCGTATVADLVAEGTNLAWYATENSTEELTAETELTSGTYYVAQSSETCEGVRIPIEVTIKEIPNAPIAFTLQEFEPGATLADLDVEGENLTWYDEEGNVLDPSTPLVDGEIYYVSQTVNGCESDTIGIETQALNISESGFANFNLYPNPVKNILHISNTTQIDNVLVFNLSGQLILEKKANTKSLELNLSHLASATYVVKIVSNNQIKTVKVIKK